MNWVKLFVKIQGRPTFIPYFKKPVIKLIYSIDLVLNVTEKYEYRCVRVCVCVCMYV